jgi:hypothetical protein
VPNIRDEIRFSQRYADRMEKHPNILRKTSRKMRSI